MMKALILAAGFGTRLRPYTRFLPKPLFTLNNRTMLELAVQKLLDCGCTSIYINTHHLADRIHDAVLRHPDSHRIETIYEPKILDTGGAVANLKHALDEQDFLVINADVVCDFDLSRLIQAHHRSDALATLLVHDCKRFNKLNIVQEDNQTGRIIDFNAPPEKGFAFTGIQALSPRIFSHMPQTQSFSSIELYKALCPTGRIRALTAGAVYWSDMGTPADYVTTSRRHLSGAIFNLPPSRFNEIEIIPISGDGSDRNWYRAAHGPERVIISDHGICIDTGPADAPALSTQPKKPAQLNSFNAIGRHLRKKGIHVPAILGHDTVSGQVAVEDLGSTHLADRVKAHGPEHAFDLYCKVIDGLVDFSQKGIRGFDPAWTCQTATYSKGLILDMECRYFINAFIKGYLEKDVCWTSFEPGFSFIADQALVHGYQGLMHRDLQSRNIMIRDHEIWFIDFQSARKGPLQYDLASLLIDPYVRLPQAMQEKLLAYAAGKLGLTQKTDKENFLYSYEYCCITRNLQMLGAFGFLTRVKHKNRFEAYIPAALAGLKQRLKKINNNNLAFLTEFVTDL